MSKTLTNDASENFYPWSGMDATTLGEDLVRHFHLTLGRDQTEESHFYLYNAAVLMIRDRLVERWRETRWRYRYEKPKRVAYFSLEFLMGRALTNTIHNLEIEKPLRDALRRYGVALEELASEEADTGLGNGGLGRLAACFLDSCATLGYAVTGYGIRYDYGMFKQKIENGYQVEYPDHWLKQGNPWEFESHENARLVKFNGHTESYLDEEGRNHIRWVNTDDVLAMPYDMPVPGYRNNTVNTLRLWKAMTTEEINLDQFNAGGYAEAVAAKIEAEQISMVLYPNDASENGKILRLRQQYFLSSASLQDVLARWVHHNEINFSQFADQNCFQLNDTHPAIAVAELMRLLVDEYLLLWDEAWEITTKTMAYTNHTLLPEALERWPVKFFRQMLPRLYEIICEINARFLKQVEQHWPGDSDKLRDMSIIEEEHEPQIRMAYLAIVGSFSVNGVAALHTQLLKDGLFRNFYELWPEKFNNKTNGVTPRRWLSMCNPDLSSLISSTIGDEWTSSLDNLEKLKEYANDEVFQRRWQEVKFGNKQKFAQLVKTTTGVEFDAEMMFDVHVKRIHEYKRQLLNVLHIIHLYQRIVNGDTNNLTPRCVLIGGKAAPGYVMAKLIIKLINSVAEVVNADERCTPYLRVAFIPNYRVSTMEVLCTGTDLSEQISTAGKEASGTGNMKFMLNGAITIGTLDGANIEIRDAVGAENFFLFGLTAEEVTTQRQHYDPNSIIENDSDLNQVMSLLESNHFNVNDPGLFASITDSIRNSNDPWMTAADFRSFVDAQQRVNDLYPNKEQWTRMSILNTASSAQFSSDRTIEEYANDIWKL